MNDPRFVIGFGVVVALALSAPAESPRVPDVSVREAPSARNPVVASLVVDHNIVKRGSSFTAWLMLAHAPGWGTY